MSLYAISAQLSAFLFLSVLCLVQIDKLNAYINSMHVKMWYIMSVQIVLLKYNINNKIVCVLYLKNSHQNAVLYSWVRINQIFDIENTRTQRRRNMPIFLYRLNKGSEQYELTKQMCKMHKWNYWPRFNWESRSLYVRKNCKTSFKCNIEFISRKENFLALLVEDKFHLTQKLFIWHNLSLVLVQTKVNGFKNNNHKQTTTTTMSLLLSL